MKIGSLNLNEILGKEVNLAVNKVLESYLNKEQDQDERRRQKEVEQQIKKRGASKPASETKEVEEAEDESEEESKPKEKAEEPKKREDRTGGKGTADSKKASTPSQEAISDPKLSSFVDKLNILRGGKSLKDPQVKNSIDKYLNSLNVKEKQALLIFLTGLSQIMVGKKSGTDALDPAEMGIRMHSKDKQKKDPNKIEKSKELGTASVPIVVGESKKNINRKLASKAYENVKNFK